MSAPPTPPGTAEARDEIVNRMGDWCEQDTQHVSTQSRLSLSDALDRYAAAVSAARDAMWREAVEAVRADMCPRFGGHLRSGCGCRGGTVDGLDYATRCRLADRNAALDALTARMGVIP